jgi:hypothetical protein
VVFPYDRAICIDCAAALDRHGRRHCKTCGEVKPLDRFHLLSRGDKRRRVCAPCFNTSRKPYQQAHRARQRELARQWRTANYEQWYATHQAWRAANRERVNAAARARRALDPERTRETNRRYLANNPEKARSYHRQYRRAHADAIRLYRARRLLAILHGGRPA